MDIGINLSINTNCIMSSTGITPPLDDYTGAQTAYSIARKLRTAYAGSAIRVRESSGDTEADIGFDADGNLDETALLAHCGSNSGYITTAYDQSGNSNDWVQATANLQPRIVNAGTVEKVNGKPAILSDTNDTIKVILTTADNSTAFHVYKSSRRSVSVYGGVGYYGISESGSATANYFSSGTPSTYINGSSVTSRDDVFTAANGLQVLYSATALSLSANYTFYETDHSATGTVYGHDYIQETIIYNSDKSSDRAAIEANINEYYSIY